jgi:hypothetical protein
MSICIIKAAAIVRADGVRLVNDNTQWIYVIRVKLMVMT